MRARKAVITAAGRGKPMFPATRTAQKKKPPLGGPEEGVRLTEMARRITYVEQPSPKGFGHAVYQAKDFVGNEPFVLLLGDHVYTNPAGASSCIAQMLD